MENPGSGEEVWAGKWEMSEIPGNIGGVGDWDFCWDVCAGRGTERRCGFSFRNAAYPWPLLVANSRRVGLKVYFA